MIYFRINEFCKKFRYKRNSVYRLHRAGHLKKKFFKENGLYIPKYAIITIWNKRGVAPEVKGFMTRKRAKELGVNGIELKIGKFIYIKR